MEREGRDVAGAAAQQMGERAAAAMATDPLPRHLPDSMMASALSRTAMAMSETSALQGGEGGRAKGQGGRWPGMRGRSCCDPNSPHGQRVPPGPRPACAPCRRGVLDHRLKHVGGHNDRLAAAPAASHDLALPKRHLRRRRRGRRRGAGWRRGAQLQDATAPLLAMSALCPGHLVLSLPPSRSSPSGPAHLLHRQLGAQVSARHHGAIRRIQDCVQVLHAVGRLNLGQHTDGRGSAQAWRMGRDGTGRDALRHGSRKVYSQVRPLHTPSCPSCSSPTHPLWPETPSAQSRRPRPAQNSAQSNRRRPGHRQEGGMCRGRQRQRQAAVVWMRAAAGELGSVPAAARLSAAEGTACPGVTPP